MLINHYNNERVLMFRMANSRSNEILAASVELHYTYPEVSPEGVKMTRFKALKLERSYSPIFALSWTVIHVLDKDSPFHGKSAEELKKMIYEFFVIFNGTDGTRSQTIHDYHTYLPHKILENHYFEDIISRREDGTRVIDYQYFHSTKMRG